MESISKVFPIRAVSEEILALPIWLLAVIRGLLALASSLRAVPTHLLAKVKTVYPADHFL